MAVYQVVVYNLKNTITELAYSLTDSPGEAVKRVLNRIEDQTPIGELPSSYTIKVTIVGEELPGISAS